MPKKIIKRYVSDVDKLLAEFDAEHPEKTPSQQREIDKHQRIAEKRDNAKRTDPDNKVWDGF